jgi:hypothetical protein
MAVPEMQYVYWGTWGYLGSPSEGPHIFGAATHPLAPSGVKQKRAGRKVQAIRARAEAVEIQHGYQEAFDFWLRVQFEDVPEAEYCDTAELFDELPGVSGYFRFLCLHTVSHEGDGYVRRRTY